MADYRKYQVEYQDGDTAKTELIEAEYFKMDLNGLVLIGEATTAPRQRAVAAFREWSSITEAVDAETVQTVEDQTEVPDVVLYRGIDYADAIRNLIHLVHPDDEVAIQATGQIIPKLEYSSTTDWLIEARDLAAEVLGKKLHRVGRTWVLVPLRGE